MSVGMHLGDSLKRLFGESFVESNYFPLLKFLCFYVVIAIVADLVGWCIRRRSVRLSPGMESDYAGNYYLAVAWARDVFLFMFSMAFPVAGMTACWRQSFLLLPVVGALGALWVFFLWYWIGAVRHHDRVRFGAMPYLVEWGRGRIRLRGPMFDVTVPVNDVVSCKWRFLPKSEHFGFLRLYLRKANGGTRRVELGNWLSRKQELYAWLQSRDVDSNHGGKERMVK